VDTQRRVAFVADGASWANSIGDSARDILLRNGVESSYIDSMVAAGTIFKLAIFDDDGTVYRADWDGVHRVLETFYPAQLSKVEAHWSALCTQSYPAIETQVGESFEALELRVGKMSPDRYMAAEDTVASARLFLQHTLSLNSQYTGTGCTADDAGGGGTPEFFADNRLLCSIPSDQIIDIDA
jgi:hypothetical protein